MMKKTCRLPHTAAILLLLLCLLTGCTRAGGDDHGQEEVHILIEESPFFTLPDGDRLLTAARGANLSFRVLPEDRCTVSGTDYRDYVIETQEDGSLLVTLHRVLYDTAVTVIAEQCPYTICYKANGGSALAGSEESVEFSYSSLHQRVSTEQGTSLFNRDGYTLTGWNTASDGTGTHVGLGSRTDMPADGELTLYAEWAGWNDASDFLFEKRQSSVTITGYTGGSNVIVIPGQLDGLPVTEIAEGAFSGTVCEAVVLPPSVRTIAVRAFYGCTLKTLTFFDSTEEITDPSFENCSRLTTIRINACVPPVYSGTYYDTFPDKYDRLLSLRDRNKLVLFSGSSARFGYDCALLDAAFGEYEIVNMGVFAYTNALPQLDLILQQMKEGDILVHSPEFDAAKRQFCTTNAFDDKFFNMIESDYGLLSLLDYREYGSILTAFRTFQTTRRGMAPRAYSESASLYDEDGVPVSSPSYNAYGDYIVPRPNSTDDAPIYDLPVAYTVAAFPEADYIDPLNAEYDRFLAKGISVCFTYAPRNEAAVSPESTPQERARLDQFFRENLHAAVISPIEDSLYPGRYLSGTDNHLSTEGVSIRTARIRRDLEQFLADPANPDVMPSEE